MNQTQHEYWRSTMICFLIEVVVVFLMVLNFFISSYRSRRNFGHQVARFAMKFSRASSADSTW